MEVDGHPPPDDSMLAAMGGGGRHSLANDNGYDPLRRCLLCSGGGSARVLLVLLTAGGLVTLEVCCCWCLPNLQCLCIKFTAALVLHFGRFTGRQTVPPKRSTVTSSNLANNCSYTAHAVGAGRGDRPMYRRENHTRRGKQEMALKAVPPGASVECLATILINVLNQTSRCNVMPASTAAAVASKSPRHALKRARRGTPLRP